MDGTIPRGKWEYVECVTKYPTCIQRFQIGKTIRELTIINVVICAPLLNFKRRVYLLLLAYQNLRILTVLYLN